MSNDRSDVDLANDVIAIPVGELRRLQAIEREARALLGCGASYELSLLDVENLRAALAVSRVYRDVRRLGAVASVSTAEGADL